MHYIAIFLEELRKTKKTSINITGVPTEMRTKHLPVRSKTFLGGVDTQIPPSSHATVELVSLFRPQKQHMVFQNIIKKNI
jgi:hypothetical protein